MINFRLEENSSIIIQIAGLVQASVANWIVIAILIAFCSAQNHDKREGSEQWWRQYLCSRFRRERRLPIPHQTGAPKWRHGAQDLHKRWRYITTWGTVTYGLRKACHCYQGALVHNALTYRSLIHSALMYRSLIHSALLYRSLIHSALTYRSLVFRIHHPCMVFWSRAWYI